MVKTLDISTKKVIFDTDCLSSFLWVNEENIILDLFDGLIVIPDDVYEELSKVKSLKEKIDKLIKNNKVTTKSILFNTPEYTLFLEMTRKPKITKLIIGNGEASAISLCVYNDGILASNNLKDIDVYVNKYNLDLLTTPDILHMAYNKKMISEDKANHIWLEMIKKKRWLPNVSFTKYLESIEKSKV